MWIEIKKIYIILKNAVSSKFLSGLSERAWKIVNVIMQMGINSVV
jgi:hypothetical protein